MEPAYWSSLQRATKSNVSVVSTVNASAQEVQASVEWFNAGFPSDDDAEMDDALVEAAQDATYDPNTEDYDQSATRLMADQAVSNPGEERLTNLICELSKTCSCPNCLKLKAINPPGFAD